jgi:hypothetical protein
MSGSVFVRSIVAETEINQGISLLSKVSNHDDSIVF